MCEIPYFSHHNFLRKRYPFTENYVSYQKGGFIFSSNNPFVLASMMNLKPLIGILIALSCSSGLAQTLEDLYTQKDYSTLITYAEKPDSLSGEDLFYIGQAFFQLEEDLRAVEMFDKTLEKGLDEDFVYLYKGLCLRFNKQYDDAIESFHFAIEKNPFSQKNHTELGNTYYLQEAYDSALVHFYRARELPYELGDPYMKIPNIFMLQEDYNKALEECKISSELIDTDDPAYLDLRFQTGLLASALGLSYDNSVAIFEEVIRMDPENFDRYPEVIQAYYALGEFGKGDSLIQVLKREYEKENLPERMQEYGFVLVDEFTWNDKPIAVFKHFKEPAEMLDYIYEAYILSEDGQSIEKRIMTEKTFQLDENSAKHLLCGKDKGGSHYTYGYGWSTDTIEYPSFKEAMMGVLNGEVQTSASSSYGSPGRAAEEKGKLGKRKKKKRRKKRNKE